MTIPTENEILDLVLNSIETGLQEHQEHVVFQQLRVAPESLIVHFAAFQMHKELEKRWPDKFDVLLENMKCDLKIAPMKGQDEAFLFEFKIPWSGGFILGETADDFFKKLRNNPRAYEVTVFLEILNPGEQCYRKPGKVKAANYAEKLRSAVEKKYPGLRAQVVRKGKSFSLASGDAEIECSVMVWKAE
jgi:hypothetical protein